MAKVRFGRGRNKNSAIEEALESQTRGVTGLWRGHVLTTKKLAGKGPRVSRETYGKTTGSKAAAKKLVSNYKKAGYDILGIANDGVVIVRPKGKPDSFDVGKLDRVLSEIRTKVI